MSTSRNANLQILLHPPQPDRASNPASRPQRRTLIRNPFCHLLDIAHSIARDGMGSAASPSLVAAVSREGGLDAGESNVGPIGNSGLTSPGRTRTELVPSQAARLVLVHRSHRRL